MTFENLRICFAPALKMNGECFRWLVCDWRSCWQGCWTEKEFLEEEYRVLEQVEHDGGNFVELATAAAARRQREQSDGQNSHIERLGTETNVTPVPTTDDTASLTAPSIAPSVASAPPAAGGGPKRRVSLDNDVKKSLLGTHAVGPGNQATAHARSASQLPELSLPQPISPFFTSEAEGH